VHEEPEDSQLDRAEIEIPAMLPSTLNAIPDAGFVEAASMSRGSSRKSIESGQLSLF
jgi:hypothetical protein